MNEPIGWVSFWKPRDAWYYSTGERRSELLERWNVIRSRAETAGAEVTGHYECRANSEWARMSVWQFPTLETLLNMLDELEEAEYYQYFAEENLLGRRTTVPYANYEDAARFTEEVA